MVCLSRTARPCHTPCAAASTEEHGDLGMAPNGELRVPLPLAQPRSTLRLSGKCWLKGGWHEISICSHRGLGKSISLESFGNLSLVALNIYCTPAHQMPKLQGMFSQAARCCRHWEAPNQPMQVLMKNSP